MATRHELEAFWQRWVQANLDCQAAADWTPLADFFAPDATYGWNCGPSDEFMAVGRDELRSLAFGQEMRGLEGWTYPYQLTVIDEQQGMVLGFWKQVAPATRADGSPYSVAGLGCSWFGYDDGRFVWQRDFFDHLNAGALFLELAKEGVLSEGMRARLSAGRAPGHYAPSAAPAPLWPSVLPPVTGMASPGRRAVEELWERWLEDNRVCEAKRDWAPLAEYYASDATYGWNCGPDDEFMAVGRDEIRELALGLEMQGLEGWSYPYQVTLVDEAQGMVVGLWKQVADATREDGSHYVVPGLGASWFGLVDGQFAWQRDFFDHGNAGVTFLEMAAAGVLSPGMTARIEAGMRGERAPGHYRRAEIPVPLWPNEAGLRSPRARRSGG